MAKAKQPKITVSKKVSFDDLIKLSAKELTAKISELQKEVVELKRNTLTGDVQNVRSYINKRRELARALTAQKQLAEEDK
jgi:ribosomal protein L29